jgi:hypothetical protein
VSLVSLVTGTSLLLAGCSSAEVVRQPGASAPGTASPTQEQRSEPTSGPTSEPTSEPTSAAPVYSTYPLGERVLPLRADGFGEIRPTPPTLRTRRYPTVDVLPPPPEGRFASSIGPVTPAVRERMGRTHQPGCPVALSDLRHLTVSFHGFDGAAHTGELVVAASAAEDVVSVFRALFRAEFPIEELRLITTADLEAPPTGDGNVTAAYVCRPTRGQTTLLSAHAYGLAIDLNPFMNPYQKGDVVLPELAGSYLDRSWDRPGMVQPGSLAVREFARIGWSWGGDFQSLKDYQHFTALDR